LVDGWAALKEDADEMESVIVRSGRNKYILRRSIVWKERVRAQIWSHTASYRGYPIGNL
jgi:hypothetical protein